MPEIDFNCDLGEGLDIDDQLMPFLNSCNIATGGHAGDSVTMRKAINSALKHQVCIGAHPSYPDRANFGRKKLAIPVAALMDSLQEQIQTFLEILDQEGARLHHIKPHGALYHALASNGKMANRFIGLIKEISPDAIIYGAPDSALEEVCTRIGHPFWREGFVDRRYDEEGNLLSRKRENALLTNPAACTEQAWQIAMKHSVTTDSGITKALRVQTLCLHGDNPNALAIAKAIHQKFAG